MLAVAASLALLQPRDLYAEKLAACYELTANVLCNLGVMAARADQHGWAAYFYRRAISHSRDHAQARRLLGYRLVDGQWVAHECREAPCTHFSTTNARSEEEALGVAGRLTVEWVEKGRQIARRWAGLAKWCEEHEQPEDALKAWREAADFDPNHEDAREALGHARAGTRGNGWLTAETAQWIDRLQTHRDAAQSALSSAPAGHEREEPTQVEQGLGLTHNRRESDHFLIESPHLGDDEITALLRLAEHVTARYQELFGLAQPALGRSMNLVFLETKAQHDRMVDVFASRGRSEREIEHLKSMGGQFGVVRAWTYTERAATPESRRDWTVHGVLQANLEHHLGGSRHLGDRAPAWLQEGLAYAFTQGTLGSAIWHCTALADTGGRARAAPTDAARWAAEVKAMVVEMRDPPILEVVNVPTAELVGVRTLKAWSLVDWLIRERRDRFGALVAELGRNADGDAGAAFRAVFDWSLEDAEERWRQYVRATYP